ncbi:MAG: disulfide bond formation protein B [Oceanococcus sp.]
MTERGLYRLMNLWGAVVCAAAMGFALYLQHADGLEPCSMCVFQRVAMIAAGVFFLAAAVHGPHTKWRYIWSGGAVLAALAGLGVAARHVWLQSLPADLVPACGPALNYLLDVMPVWEVVHSILRGDGNCAVIDWQFLGLSLPAWTGVGFFLLLDWALMALLLPRLVARAQAAKAAA